MDRRDFLKVFLTTPLLPKLLSASPPSSGLFILSDTPHLVLPDLLALLPLPRSRRPSFTFLSPHPDAPPLRQALSLRGWSFRRDPASADALLSFVTLHHPSPPSFTLVQDGRVRDVRSSRLLSFWNTMQASRPSTLLTSVAFPGSLAPASAGFVAVFHKGREVARFPLSGRLTRTFEDVDGAVKVRVERGRAWVSESSCAQKICRHSPPATQPGERIICAPNRFLLAVTAPHGIDTSIG